MITLKRKFITVGELWFDEPVPATGADLLAFYHWTVPLNPVLSKPFYSIEIDLRQDAERLLGDMKKDMRYKIGRAEKDGMDFQLWSAVPGDVLERFCDFYDGFAATRGLSPAHRSWMRRYAAADKLAVSCMMKDGVPVVWHTYYRDATHVRQLQSVSHYQETTDPGFRNMVGRANRLLHWRDMQSFKEAGIELFDMGGWYEGQDDEAKLRINQFKEEFGGTVSKRFYSMRPLTFRGRFFLWARNRRVSPDDRFIQMA